MKVNIGHIGSSAVALFAALWGGVSIAQDVGAAPEPVAHMPMMDLDQPFRVVTRKDGTSASKCIGKMISPLCAVETYLAARLREDWPLHEIALGRMDPKERIPVEAITLRKRDYRIMSAKIYDYDQGTRTNLYDIKANDVAVYLETCDATDEPCTLASEVDGRSYLLRQGTYGWHVVSGKGFKVDLTDPRKVEYEGW